MAARPRKRDLSPKARRALELLASNPLGTTEAFMSPTASGMRRWQGLCSPGSQRS